MRDLILTIKSKPKTERESCAEFDDLVKSLNGCSNNLELARELVRHTRENTNEEISDIIEFMGEQ